MKTDRRSLLKGVGAGGLLAATGAAAPVLAQTRTTYLPPVEDWLRLQPDARGIVRFAVDIAVIGNSDAINTAGRIGDPESQDYFNIDVRGDSFYVEGALYPGGTIPDPSTPTPGPRGKVSPHYELNWDFTRSRPVGHWFTRGWALINASRQPSLDTRGTVVETRRTEPHLLTEQNYVFGRFTPDNLSPEMLVSNGTFDGDDVDKEVVVRAITGGTGRFRFARGQVVQHRHGRNTTVLRSFSQFPEAYSPNYRLEFELKLD